MYRRGRTVRHGCARNAPAPAAAGHVVVDVMRRRDVDGSGLDVHGSGSGSGVVYHGVEATVVVGGVLHSPDGAVGFVEGVGNALVTPPLRVSMGGADCLPSVVDVVRRRDVHGSGLDVHGSGSGSGVVYHGVEATVVVGGVLHSPDGAVGFVEGVRALHDITVAGLLLGLVVTGVAVSYGVVVLVFGRDREPFVTAIIFFGTLVMVVLKGRGSLYKHGSSFDVDWRGSGRGVVHNCVETVVVISSVFYSSDGATSFVERFRKLLNLIK
ncbi:unnamed protein product [Spodoptera exigua]|nr:unnamed protein product [Spodoptera exigua]